MARLYRSCFPSFPICGLLAHRKLLIIGLRVPGDVIKCLPGVEHWHGASPKSDFAYIAVTPTQKGKTVWLKPVTDEEYNGVK
jgi:hypothetical protein